jgi:galactitol-specific phosphotransferase system IIB component
MSIYEITIVEKIKHTVEVEALNEDEALTKGYDIVMNGPDDEYDSESQGSAEAYVIRIN